MTTSHQTREADEARRIAKRILEGSDTTMTWRDAGYASAEDAASALVGDGYDADVRAIAIRLVAAEIE